MQQQVDQLPREAAAAIRSFVADIGPMIKPVEGRHQLTRGPEGSFVFKVENGGKTIVSETIKLPGAMQASLVNITAANGKNITFLALQNRNGSFALGSESGNGENEVFRSSVLFIRPAPPNPFLGADAEITFKATIVDKNRGITVEGSSIKELVDLASQAK
ncbi:MAG TPA: hypothetical protein PLP17_08795 [Oligoflexia bacterium]|nr:hypothetical protein [Oligoflexia bacterium]